MLVPPPAAGLVVRRPPTCFRGRALRTMGA